MAEISVLVPVYNVKSYLSQCLDSIRAQSFTDLEIICVNDGSTDGSEEILDRYAALEPRMKVIQKENTGYGSSMNRALELASGQYIAILESDDFAEPDMMWTLHEMAVMHHTDVVKGTFYNYRYGKDTVSKRLDPYPKGILMNCNTHPEILDMADTIWSCLYRREFLTKYHIRFHETPGASYQDISFALQVWLFAKRVVFMDRAVVHYRRDNPGSSMNHPGKLFCVFDEYEWIEERFHDFFNQNPKIDAYLTAVKYRDCFDHYHRVGVQFQYALLCRMQSMFQKDKQAGRIQEYAFRPVIWELVGRMEQDRDKFFLETAKRIYDDGLNSSWFENQKIYGNAFVEMLKTCKQLVIYGAGQVGQRFAVAVMDMGIQIDGFAVTSLAGQDNVCLGIPVREIGEYARVVETCTLVIAVAIKSQASVYESMREYGFRHIFRVDDAVRNVLFKE